MRSLDRFSRVWLHREAVDMRKSIDGLSGVVLGEMGLAFDSESLFVFMGRCGRKLKMLYWDETGFALWYKRLEGERFVWPKECEDKIIDATSDQLQGLLAGFDMFQKPHKILRYDRIG